MEYFVALLLGVAAAAGAVLPPGMLNMSVATTSLQAGQRAGYWYTAGIVTVFLVQAGLAIIGVNFLRANKDIVELLSWWAIPVLAFLAVFFLIKWYRHEHTEGEGDGEQNEDLRHPYLQGVSVSLMNFLAIPYFFAVGTWLMSQGVLDYSVAAKALFVGGAAAGAGLILAGYARGAEWIDAHAHYITRHVHLLVGIVFGLLAGVQSYRVYFAQ